MNVRFSFNVRIIFRREVNYESAPSTRLAIDFDSPTMGFHNMLDDRETEAVSFYVVHKSSAHAIELLEDLTLILARDTDAMIDHGDGYIAAILTHPDQDLS